MKPRKPLNVGDMVKVYDTDIKSDIWLSVDAVDGETITVICGALRLIHRNQVYRVKRKVKKKASVWPKFLFTDIDDTLFLRILREDFPKLTKKQRKLYKIPENIK